MSKKNAAGGGAQLDPEAARARKLGAGAGGFPAIEGLVVSSAAPRGMRGGPAQRMKESTNESVVQADLFRKTGGSAGKCAATLRPALVPRPRRAGRTRDLFRNKGARAVKLRAAREAWFAPDPLSRPRFGRTRDLFRNKGVRAVELRAAREAWSGRNSLFRPQSGRTRDLFRNKGVRAAKLLWGRQGPAAVPRPARPTAPRWQMAQTEQAGKLVLAWPRSGPCAARQEARQRGRRPGRRLPHPAIRRICPARHRASIGGTPCARLDARRPGVRLGCRRKTGPHALPIVGRVCLSLCRGRSVRGTSVPGTTRPRASSAGPWPPRGRCGAGPFPCRPSRARTVGRTRDRVFWRGGPCLRLSRRTGRQGARSGPRSPDARSRVSWPH